MRRMTRDDGESAESVLAKMRHAVTCQVSIRRVCECIKKCIPGTDQGPIRRRLKRERRSRLDGGSRCCRFGRCRRLRRLFRRCGYSRCRRGGRDRRWRRNRCIGRRGLRRRRHRCRRHGRRRYRCRRHGCWRHGRRRRRRRRDRRAHWTGRTDWLKLYCRQRRARRGRHYRCCGRNRYGSRCRNKRCNGRNARRDGWDNGCVGRKRGLYRSVRTTRGARLSSQYRCTRRHWRAAWQWDRRIGRLGGRRRPRRNHHGSNRRHRGNRVRCRCLRRYWGRRVGSRRNSRVDNLVLHARLGCV